jgi:hypothetical protein
MTAVPISTVIDSVVIASLLRSDARTGRALRRPTVLDAHIDRRALVIVIDETGGIVDEWQRTAGDDVRVVLTRWIDAEGVSTVVPARSLPRSLRQCDPGLRLRDAGDKLIVRTAIALRGCRITSHDSDFWHPDRHHSGGMIGDPNAPVCTLLRGCGITVETLETLLGNLAA